MESPENLSSLLFLSYLSTCTIWLMIRILLPHEITSKWKSFHLSIKHCFTYTKTWPTTQIAGPSSLGEKTCQNILTFFGFNKRDMLRNTLLFTNVLGFKRWFASGFVNKFESGNFWGIFSRAESERALGVLKAGHELLPLTEKFSLRKNLSFHDFPSQHDLSTSPFLPCPWEHLVPGILCENVHLQYSVICAQLTTPPFWKQSLLLAFESLHIPFSLLTNHSSFGFFEFLQVIGPSPFIAQLLNLGSFVALHARLSGLIYLHSF